MSSQRRQFKADQENIQNKLLITLTKYSVIQMPSTISLFSNRGDCGRSFRNVCYLVNNSNMTILRLRSDYRDNGEICKKVNMSKPTTK